MPLPTPIDELNHYVETGGCRYHVTSSDGAVSVRLVDTDKGLFALSVQMPASNLALLRPERPGGSDV